MALRNLKLMQDTIRQCNRQIPVLTTNVREIKKWVRPVILSFQHRKKQLKFQEVYPTKPTPRSSFTEWNYNSELYAFTKRLGENFDDSLLRVAFTDQTYISSELERQESLGLVDLEPIQDNGNLAVEGLHLIKKTITKILTDEFPKLPQEAKIKLCTVLTTPENLAEISTLIGTKDLILSNDYPPAVDVSCRTLCAIVAVLEKSSGTERARKFIIDIIMTQLVGKDMFEMLEIEQPWSLMVNTLRERGQAAPEPRLIGQAGRNTILGAFIVGLYDSDKQLIGKGFGETLDIGHEQAAKDVLRELYGLRRLKNGLDVFK